MKLIITIVNKEDAKVLGQRFSKNNFSATKIEGKGSFLEKQNSIFLIGTDDKNVKKVVEIIKECCKSREENISPTPQSIEPGELIIPEAEKVITSGAIIFILEVSETIKL